MFLIEYLEKRVRTKGEENLKLEKVLKKLEVYVILNIYGGIYAKQNFTKEERFLSTFGRTL